MISTLKGRSKLATLLLLVLLLCLSGCWQIHAGPERVSDMHWFEDTSGSMSFDEVRHKDLSTQWNKAGQKYPNLGFTMNPVWLSLSFANTSDIPTPMLLEMAFPLHDEIDFYLLDGNEVVSKFHTGDSFPFSERPLKHRNFLFPHTVLPHTELRAIVRVHSSDTMYLPAKVWASNEFLARDQSEVLFLGVFFGLLSIMLVYNLFLYFSTKHKNYLYYVACTGSIIYLQLTQKGLGYQYLWSEQANFNHISVPISGFLATLTSLIFITKFLNLNKKEHPKALFTCQTLMTILVIATVASAVILPLHHSLISYTEVLLIVAILGGIGAIFIASLLIYLSIKNNRSAQVLAIAWLFLLGGSLLFTLGRVGMGLPIPMLLSENAMLIGSTLEAAFISFALAMHIRRERDARMIAQELALTNERKSRDAQNSLLALKERTTQQLEQEVHERTKKLELAMDELRLANQKLDNLSRFDSLTGLSNRRNFDQEFHSEWLSCMKQKQPISLLMADIDHFKAINDNCGHLFGDQCLMGVAKVLKGCVSKPKDLAARFGGEEFIIMLPSTSLRGANIVAELVRSEVETLRLEYQDRPIRFTISIGIASIVPAQDSSFIELNEKADQALYLAKEYGRNRVVTFDSEVKTAKRIKGHSSAMREVVL